MTSSLKGRRILVTGAASGIGAQVAQDLAAQGALLAALDVEESQLRALAKKTGALPLQVDLLDAEATDSAVRTAARELGGLDGVVNSAGIADQTAIDALDLARWSRVIAVNLTAPYVICRSALPFLAAAEGAAIVNIASAVALLPDSPRTTAYAASKGGLVAFTKALAAEAAPRVRVNAVCPGLTHTPMVEGAMAAAAAIRSPSTDRYALRRGAKATEISSAIRFLLGPESSFVTGIALAVDGGRTFH